MLSRFGRLAVVLALVADLILVGRVTARPDQTTAWLEAEPFECACGAVGGRGAVGGER